MSLSHSSDEKARPVICERVTKTPGGRQPASGCRLGDRSVGGAGGFCLEISLSVLYFCLNPASFLTLCCGLSLITSPFRKLCLGQEII